MDAVRRTTWPMAIYAATVFLSAFLLFQIQPLVSKAILPWFGGSPTVWTTCLLFFQTLLFVGYALAHASYTWLRPRQQAAAYIVILAAAVLLMRVLPSERWAPGAGHDPVWRILAILAASVGLPYLALAATGPLVQAWFGRLFPGSVPYRLYALSNFGSLLALLSYPFLFEWMFDLPQQAQLWSWGFAAFALVAAFAAGRMWTAAAASSELPVDGESEPRPRWLHYASWLGWPACAVIALMATTNHVSTDVAAMPFLWVVPLALYLITFIIAFERPGWHRPTLVAAMTLVAIYGSAATHRSGAGWLYLYESGTTGRTIHLLLAAINHDGDSKESAAESPPSREPPPAPSRGPSRAQSRGPRVYVGFLPFLTMHCAAMFGICLLCHGELARRRPSTRFLTAYYLMIAAGGALGGAAVTLLAPRIFNTMLEWKLAMFAGCLGTLGLILHALVKRAVRVDDSAAPARFAVWPIFLLMALLVPTAFVILDLVEYLHAPKKGILLQSRNFFGTLTIRERNPENPRTHNLVLLHGATVHGSQFVAANRRGQPTTYYSTPSGVGRTLNYYRRTLREGGGVRIGSVGLGTGTLAAYAGDGDSIRFYEIDSAVVDIATSGQWFTYLSDCRARGAKTEMALGDARLSFENEKVSSEPASYHVLVLDAFSGDAIAIHLLTAEAFELYLTRLTTASADGEDGALVVHVSNRYLDLARIVRGAAERFGIEAVHIHTPGNPPHSINSADWIILSRNQALLDELKPYARETDDVAQHAVLWTDARSSLFDVLK